LTSVPSKSILVNKYFAFRMSVISYTTCVFVSLNHSPKLVRCKRSLERHSNTSCGMSIWKSPRHGWQVLVWYSDGELFWRESFAGTVRPSVLLVLIFAGSKISLHDDCIWYPIRIQPLVALLKIYWSFVYHRQYQPCPIEFAMLNWLSKAFSKL